MVELEAKIKEIIPRTYNVMSFRIGMGENINFKAGQFLLVTLTSDPELKRYLSISSSPTEKGHLEFTKKITESEFCNALKNLKVGDLVKIKYPLGNFILKDEYKKVAFISGGIGITPIRSICKYVVDKKTEADIVLIYANRTVKDIAFREDFDEMCKQYPKLKVVHVLSESAQGIECKSGRINTQIIKDSIPDFSERKFYLCGPPAMVEAIQNILTKELAVAEGNIITENFQGY